MLSVAKITEHGFEVVFGRNDAVVGNPRTEEKLMIDKKSKDLYYVDESTEESRTSQTSSSPLQEWHERFGHLNIKDLKDVILQKRVDEINIKVDKNLPVCETCIKGKQTQKSFPKSVSRSTEILEQKYLVFVQDLC